MAALLLLLDEPHDRRVALGELALVGEVCERTRRRDERGRRDEYEEEGSSHASGFDAAAGFASLLRSQSVELRNAAPVISRLIT